MSACSADVACLCACLQTPYARTAVGTGKALNSLCWAPSGKKIGCGDATGHVYIYDISEVRLLVLITFITTNA